MDLDTGRVELPEDLPALPDRLGLTNELLLVFHRFKDTKLLEINGAERKFSSSMREPPTGVESNEEEGFNSGDNGVKYRRREHARSEERTLKRYGRKKLYLSQERN